MTLAYAIHCGYLDKTTYTLDGLMERSSSSLYKSYCMTHSHCDPTSRSSMRIASLADYEVLKKKANDSRFSYQVFMEVPKPLPYFYVCIYFVDHLVIK